MNLTHETICRLAGMRKTAGHRRSDRLCDHLVGERDCYQTCVGGSSAVYDDPHAVYPESVLLMLIIGLIRRKHSLFCPQRMERKDLPLFLLAGFCQPFLYYMLETYAYDALNSPTIAETLLSTSPLLSPVLRLILLRERITGNNIFGILVSRAVCFTYSCRCGELLHRQLLGRLAGVLSGLGGGDRLRDDA